jgi:hypothetical protein
MLGAVTIVTMLKAPRDVRDLPAPLFRASDFPLHRRIAQKVDRDITQESSEGTS